MSQVSSMVTIGVVFEDLGCLASVEPLVLEGCDEQSLNLGQCQSGSFFLTPTLPAAEKAVPRTHTAYVDASYSTYDARNGPYPNTFFRPRNTVRWATASEGLA